MRAMVLTKPGSPLELTDLPGPEPAQDEILLRVTACGVCRTDLHVVDGELADPALPLVPGHEIVGRIEKLGPGVTGFTVGERVGVPWLGETCGHCPYCLDHHENLCDAPTFTGYTRNGGYAELTIANAQFCFPIPDRYDDVTAAPLLCAGLIGYRAYRMTNLPESRPARLGLYGFGAAAHILAQLAIADGHSLYAFTRPADTASQQFARDLGAVWAGPSDAPSPEPLDAAIIFAPVGALVPAALRATRKGATVVCAGIHMSDIPAFPYSILWEERRVVSVANLTREDGEDFFARAAETPIATHTIPYALEDANQALDDLRHGRFQGAAVLVP
jgi:propanol-preferring alcohol dehydrogenase